MRRLGRLLLCLAAAAWPGAASAGSPPAPPKTPAPAPRTSPEASAANAEALFAKVVENLGGREKIATIRDVRTRGQVTATAPGGEEMTMGVETTMVFPDRVEQEVDSPFGRIVMVSTPAGAYVVGSEGVKDLPNAVRDDQIRQMQRTAFFLAQKVGDPKFSVRLAGDEKVGEVQARALDVSYGDVSVRWLVDPDSGRIVRSSHETATQNGKTMRVESTFSDYRPVEGFTLPHRLEVTTDGSPEQTLVLEEIKINAGVDPKLFEKPHAPTVSPTARPAS